VAAPDVTDLRMVRLIQQDVCRRHISMNNSLRVDEVHPSDEAPYDRRLPCIVKFGQRLARTKLFPDVRW
jgi:hypothetical protein